MVKNRFKYVESKRGHAFFESWFLVLGSWLLNLGSRLLTLGSRFLALGSRSVALGSCILVLASLFLASAAFGQNKNNSTGRPAMIVAAKPISNEDSAMVKDLFFKALREKTSENLSLAGEFFDKIIHIDPANDASLYELANIKKTQNKYAKKRKNSLWASKHI